MDQEDCVVTGPARGLIGAPYVLIETLPKIFSLARTVSPTSDNAGFFDFEDDLELVLDEDIVEDKEFSKPKRLIVPKQNFGLVLTDRLREEVHRMGFPYLSFFGYQPEPFVNLLDSSDSFELQVCLRVFNRKYDLGIHPDFLH